MNHDCCLTNCQIYPDDTRRRNPNDGEYNANASIPDTDDPYSQDGEYCNTNP